MKGIRAAVAAIGLAGAIALAAAGCPSVRNGTQGQLAQAATESESAARSGALALQVWRRGRSTANLTSVQLTDARDAVSSAYRTVAESTVDPPQANLQRSLADEMNRVVGLLDSARQLVGEGPPPPDGVALEQELLAAADTLGAKAPT